MIRIKINLSTRTYVGKGYGFVLPLVIILLAAPLFLYLREKVGSNMASIKRLENRITIISEKLVSRDTSMKIQESGPDMEVLRDISDKREFSWITALDNIEKAIPAGISLSAIQPTFKEGGVRLSGLARDFSILSRFVDNLERLKVYKRVFLLNHSVKDMDNDRTAIIFNINVEGKNDHLN